MIESQSLFNWFTVRVEPRAEQKVAERAKQFEIETYFPIEKYLVPARNGLMMNREPQTKPAMPGYVFARLPMTNPRFDLFHPPYMQDHNYGTKTKVEPIDHIGQLVEFDGSTPRSIEGARGVLSTPSGPEPVADAIIADLKEREQEGEFDYTQKTGKHYLPRWIQKGRAALILAGPFKGFVGSIEKTIGYRSIQLWVVLFGQPTTIELPLSLVERVR